MHRTIKLLALAAISVGGLASQAVAQMNHGDLVLYFQNPLGTGAANTIYVNLGSAANTFRGAATGPDVANMVNIINIGSDLSAAFGANWATEANLHMGVAAARSNGSTLGGTGGTINGDPNRTVYVGDQRNSLGTEGSANSSGYSGFTDGVLGSAAGGIIGMNNPFKTVADANSSVVETLTTSASQIDEQNPFLVTPTVQNAAFNSTFAGGVQQSEVSSGKPANFGTFGPVANVEFMLDLYRIVSVTGKTGQLAGDVPGVGSYEGTIVLDDLGNVSFITSASAVPEPSSALLLGAGLGGFCLIRWMRRRRKNSLATPVTDSSLS